MHKYQGKYYLTYPGLYENHWPEHMYYAIADKPLGPHTEGWQAFDMGLVHLKVDESRLRFYNGGKHQESSLMVDSFLPEQAD